MFVQVQHDVFFLCTCLFHDRSHGWRGQSQRLGVVQYKDRAERVTLATDVPERELLEIFEFVEDTCAVEVVDVRPGTRSDESTAEMIQRSAGLERGTSETSTLRVW